MQITKISAETLREAVGLVASTFPWEAHGTGMAGGTTVAWRLVEELIEDP